MLAKTIKSAALASGYIDCGIMAARSFDAYAEALQQRMARFPGTRELYEPMFSRVDPFRGAPWTRSIVVCIHQYGKYRLPPGLDKHIGRNYLADRRAAVSPDREIPAHFRARLRALGLRVKRGGVPERLAGMLAGVVRIGRNGFGYHPHAGSWINIESWRVDAQLPSDAPTDDCPCPADCRRCIEACPTGALCAPYLMRMDQCIAHLTYSAPHPIPDLLWHAMGPWIYGCDACQQGCPLNRNQWRHDKAMPWLDTIRDRLTPAALMSMDEDTYRRIVHPLFWYIPEDGLERWHANAERAYSSGNGNGWMTHRVR